MPRIFTAVLIGSVLYAGPCGADVISYSVNAGWLFPGGSEGNLFHGQSPTPTSVTSGGDFSRHGALCPASGTPDFLCARVDAAADLTNDLITLHAEARLTRHDGVGTGSEELTFGQADVEIFDLGTSVATPIRGYAAFNFGLAGLASATVSDAAVTINATGIATLAVNGEQHGIQCAGTCPPIVIPFTKDPTDQTTWNPDQGFAVHLRADANVTPPVGVTGWDAEAIADFHDTLTLESIEIQDTSQQPVPGAHFIIANFDGKGNDLAIPSEPGGSPTSTTTSSTLAATTTTAGGSSTTSSSTTTSLRTTTTAVTSTTTSVSATSTTLPGGCDSQPVAATFASLDCRLAALVTLVNDTPGLGSFGPKLLNNVQQAKDDEEAAATFCGKSDVKHARQRLKKAARALIDYVHRLNGHAARKKLAAIRQTLIAAGQPIGTDLGSPKRTVTCPADAAASN